VASIGFLLTLRDAEASAPRIGAFWADILHGAEKYARGCGDDVVFRGLRGLETHPRFLDQVADLRLDAALLVGPASDQTVAALTQQGTRVVLVDNAAPGSGCTAVLSDNFSGAIAAVNHLLDLGHRDIAFIGGPQLDGIPGSNRIYSIHWRALGYRTALRERGLDVRAELVESCDLTSEGGGQAAQRLLDACRFTAVFCANDPTAYGVLRTLRERGLAVPSQISVVGFDDDIAYHSVPPLTTLRVPREEMGAAAVRALLDQPVQGDVTVILPVELVVRESTAPPAQP
jgi:LacI family transcriptional regulator